MSTTTEKIRLAPGLYLLADVAPAERGRIPEAEHRGDAKAARMIFDRYGIPEAVEPILRALDPGSDLTAAVIVYGYAMAREGRRSRVESFARAACLSRRAVLRYMKEHDGLCTKEAMDFGIFARAVEVLRGPDRVTCSMAATRCGFADPFTFSNWMKNRFGLRPSQLRKDPKAPVTIWKEVAAR